MTAKNHTLYVITANRLRDGEVVYLGSEARWVASLAEGLATDDAGERDRSLAWAKTREGDVCGAYALEVSVTPGGERRLSTRERLRAAGAADARRRLGYPS